MITTNSYMIKCNLLYMQKHPEYKKQGQYGSTVLVLSQCMYMKLYYTIIYIYQLGAGGCTQRAELTGVLTRSQGNLYM